MGWSKSYVFSALPYSIVLFLVTLLCLGLTVWAIDLIIECNKLCDESGNNPRVCRRDFWGCEVKYQSYHIEVNYVLPLVMIVFGALGLLGFTHILFSDISYVEVNAKGITVTRGYLYKREYLITREDIVEVKFQPHGYTWLLLPIFARAWSVPMLMYMGAGEVEITTRSKGKIRIRLHTGDIIGFVKAVEKELGIQVVEVK